MRDSTEREHHKVVVMALDENNNLHTYKFHSFKNYLLAVKNEKSCNYKLYKVEIDGKEITNFTTIWDFNIYARHNSERQVIYNDAPQTIIDNFLMNETERKRRDIVKHLEKGSSDLHSFYENEGGGHYGIMPGDICGFDFSGKEITIEWIDDNSDLHVSKVKRSVLLASIKKLIKENRYIPQSNKQHVLLDDRQLDGQMNIFDYL